MQEGLKLAPASVPAPVPVSESASVLFASRSSNPGPTPPQVIGSMNASVFFSRAAALMQEGNAPATADASFVSDLAKIGIVPGKAFDFFKQSSRIQTQLNAAVVIGRKKVVYYNGKWRLICDFVFYSLYALHACDAR